MGYLKLILSITVFSLFLPTFTEAETLFLRVADGKDEGAIFVYHLKETIPEKYRKWIIKLDYGPEDESIVIPNLPDRGYKLDLPPGKEATIRILIEGISGTVDDRPARFSVIPWEGSEHEEDEKLGDTGSEAGKKMPARGNLWEGH